MSADFVASGRQWAGRVQSRWEAFADWVASRDYATLRTQLDYQTGFLGGCAFVAALLLSFGNLITAGSIERRLAEDMQTSLRQVIPDALHDNDLLRDSRKIATPGRETGWEETEVHLARRAGQIIGVAFRMQATDGYAGPIVMVMGLDPQGTILGLRVISHTETPGLGDKIEVAKADWIRAFDGRSLLNTALEKWKVKKDGGDFDQFAGATITPRAVVNRAAGGLRFFQAHREEILK